MRLSTRIALAVGVMVPLLVFASGALLVQLVGRDARAEQVAHLRDRAALLAPLARTVITSERNGRPVQEQTRQRRLFADALDVGVRVVAADGTILSQGGPQPGDSVPLPASAQSPVAVNDGIFSWQALSRPITGAQAGQSGQAVSTGQPVATLWVFSPSSLVKSQVGAVRRRVFLTALIATPVGALLAWAIAERATLPLRRLQRRASGLDPRGSAARLEHAPSRVTEVDDLARSLQTLLARYDEQAARTGEALATARSFSAAASHELRTPLMSMQTNLEILSDHTDLDPVERAEVLADLRGEQARLLGLLGALRALAQGDLVEADAFTAVDLGELVEASAADVARRHPGARMSVQAGSGLRIRGWEPGLRMAIDNLLGNAIVHGRGPGAPPEVEVVLRASGDRALPAAVLTVDDAGPGIPTEAREQVFQRFHRGPDSPGTGLGLTLVAQQVDLHRGTVRVSDRPDGPGTRFEVCLPLLEGADTDTRTVELPRRRDWLSRPTA